MKKFYQEYAILIIIFCISIITIGTSIFALNGNGLKLLKNRIGATVVDAVPTGSTITDVEFYSQLVDSYNAI